MNTTFIIRGGAGKAITCIPALEKYHRLNPHDDFKVLCPHESLFYNHPILQKRVFGDQGKGTFENHIKNNFTVSPEPYERYEFYNQKCNLVEAYDKIINNTDNHSDLSSTFLYTSEFEKKSALNYIRETKKNFPNKKVVIFQPFGSAAKLIDNDIVDVSNRSINYKTYNKIINSLSDYACIFYAGYPELRPANDFTTFSFDNFGPYYRSLISLMHYCDLFVGVDSIGSHAAYALKRKGVVLAGGTDERNFCYPDHFSVFKKDINICYAPWRVSDREEEFAFRANDGNLVFSEEENNEIANRILEILKDA